MSSEQRRAELLIAAPASRIFEILSDPTSHADIDGTGWVCDPLDTELLTGAGQRFRMAMHHDQHPTRDYQMTNEVVAYDAPRLIVWRPGQPGEHGEVEFGGWSWGYQLAAVSADATIVTLTYDWSAATREVREFIDFPPFEPAHLDNSLAHLAALAAARTS